MKRAPVAPKASAAGVSGAVAGAALYLLQTYVFRGSVPGGVASLIYAATPGVIAFAAAYLAPHQPRPGGSVMAGDVTMGRLGPVGPVDPGTGRSPEPPPAWLPGMPQATERQPK